MRQWLYHILVERKPEIHREFLFWRTQNRGFWKTALHLLKRNLQWFLLGQREFLYLPPILPVLSSESALSQRESPQAFAERLEKFDAVSFDVFDTLIFRPFSHPADLFYLVGQQLCYPDFRRLRMEAERRAREEKQERTGSGEVTLEEIWEVMERETGIPKEKGMIVEWEWEKRCCFANPYMAKVVEQLKEKGKQIFALSDMYLGEEKIRQLLESCGYGKWDFCLVSGDQGVSKQDGGLYRLAKRQFPSSFHLAHVGDHPVSDGKKARENGFVSFLYPNIQEKGNAYRTQDMSPVLGSVYRGLVNTCLHCGRSVYSREYEYGFVYGGLFALGYCRFIHDYLEQHPVDRLLFFSRDGFLLQKIYCLLYPEESHKTAYARWSRTASLKITARYYKSEYFHRFLVCKANGCFSISQILEGMDLAPLFSPLCRDLSLAPDEKLTHKNLSKVKGYLLNKWDTVLSQYAGQVEAGRRYYSHLLQGCGKVAAVDLGWAGSGAVMLDTAVNRIWGMTCPVVGILGGSLSQACWGGDFSDPLISSGSLVPYLFHSGENRDIWKLHDPGKKHNLYWELLLGAPEGSLLGFYPQGEEGWRFRFRSLPVDASRILEIHRGIFDFVRLFLSTEKRLGMAFPISGRDAYAPMLSVEHEKNRDFMRNLEELLDAEQVG